MSIPDTHAEAWTLLPWLVNGRISDEDREWVAPHVDGCEECRREVEAQRAIAGQMRDEPLPQTLNAERSFGKLWTRIEASEAAVPANDVQSVPMERRGTSRTVRWLAAAVVVQAVGLATLGLATWNKGDFVTVTDPTPVSSGEAPEVRLVFDPSTSVGTMNELLGRHGLTIVSGPEQRWRTHGGAVRQCDAGVDRGDAVGRSERPLRATCREIAGERFRPMRALLILWLLCFLSTAAFAQTITLAPRDSQVAPDRYVVVTIANPQTSRPGAVGGTAHGYGGGGGYRVSASAAAVARDLAQRYSLTAVAEWPIEALQMHCIVFKIATDAPREAVLQTLRADRRVLIAQELNEFTPSTAIVPPPANDPYARLQENVRALDVLDAHRFSKGQGVRVAIIDTGIDTEHPGSRGPLRRGPELRRRGSRRASQGPARHPGRRPDRCGGEQRHRHRRRRAGSAAHRAEGVLAGQRGGFGPLQFVHARAGARGCARGAGAGDQSQPCRAFRSRC